MPDNKKHFKDFLHFETGKLDKDNYRSYYFHDPIKKLTLTKFSQVQSYFNEIEELSKKYYLAGTFSYELGYLFEEKFNYRSSHFPLAQFLVFKNAKIIDHHKRINHDQYTQSGDLDYKIANLKMDTGKEKYLQNINRIKEYIIAGDIFQANYTVKYKFEFKGSPLGLYRDLKKKQKVSYNVFGRIGDTYILSLSPELFFYKQGEMLTVKPMKGTFQRGRDAEEDEKNRKFLFHDEKNRSENIMIVDLLRNDMGKISRTGSVKPIKLFEIEKYDTLFQMTSTIQSRLQKETTFLTLIRSIFPSGSVTGAPKIRSMEIIRELEREERKIYTGAIGFIEPGGDAHFNVPIRTVLINNSKGEMGIGSGIIYDSDPEAEYEECILKTQFLIKDPIPPFQLIETLPFDKTYKYLKLHLKRLETSAEYFDFKFNKEKVKRELQKLRPSLNKGIYKIRILLDHAGNFTVQNSRLNKTTDSFHITVSKLRTESPDIFFFHKTTNRSLYDDELRRVRKKGFYEVIFLNEKEELTEGAITNIYIEKERILYTPPVSCGLLNGTIRQTLIKRKKIREKVLSIQDLKEADSIYISNSIIGLQKATMDANKSSYHKDSKYSKGSKEKNRKYKKII
ncbi:MAG: aminodeoxychorismate synthase component I [Spirochaetes bacterium]|nr:aminodeoxychorismate synthase component I [Spirochaetota bacterium]